MRFAVYPAANRGRLIRSIAALAAALVLCIGFGSALYAAGRPAPAAAPHEAVFTVDSTGDLGDALPGDGACLTAGGACTLRAALDEANSGTGPAIIQFDVTLPATIQVGQTLFINAGITVEGPTTGTVVLDGQGLYQILNIGPAPGASVRVANVSLARGDTDQDGGAAIVQDAPGAGEVVFERVVFEGNTAANRGGALFSQGRVRVVDSLFENNTATSGGAVANHGGSLRVERTTLTANSAGSGGALFNSDNGVIKRHGVMTVTVSTLADNVATANGGALYNASQEGYGAAVWVRGSTVVRNRVDAASAAAAGGGAFNGDASTLVLNNTIMAANSRVFGGASSWDDCYSKSMGVGATGVGATGVGATGNAAGVSPSSYLTGGDNVVGGGTSVGCPASRGDVQVDASRVFSDVLDTQLASHDGSQPMFALLAGSPAIDITPAGSQLCGGALTVDQRGAPKPLGAACDAGAYEAALPKIVISRTLSTDARACTGEASLELATGATAYACATVVNEGNVALTRTVIAAGTDNPLRLTQPLLPGQAITLTAKDLPALGPQTVAADTTEALAGQGDSPWSTPPGVDQQAAGSGESRARPVDINMKVTAQPFGFGAIRTVTATVSYHPQLAVIPQRLVKLSVTGGTTATLPAQSTNAAGETTFTYISFSPLTLANGAPRGVTRTRALAAGPAALAATDFIQVWVDYNGNGVRDPFEPFTAAGLPTAISLASFEAQPENGGAVLLQWRTATEVNVAGFNLHRATRPEGPYVQVNPALIPSQGTGLGSAYQYADHPRGRGAYYYKLEEVDTDGNRVLHGPVVVDVAGPAHVLWAPWVGR